MNAEEEREQRSQRQPGSGLWQLAGTLRWAAALPLLHPLYHLLAGAFGWPCP